MRAKSDALALVVQHRRRDAPVPSPRQLDGPAHGPPHAAHQQSFPGGPGPQRARRCRRRCALDDRRSERDLGLSSLSLSLARTAALGREREGQRGCPLVAVCRPASLRLSLPSFVPSSLSSSTRNCSFDTRIALSLSLSRSPVVRNEGEIVKAMLKRDSSTATASVRPQAPRPSPPRAPPPRRLPARASAEPACTTRSSATSRRACRGRGRGRTRR